MAAIESLSSCGPQPNCQPPPPRAQAPKPTGVMWISEFPSLRVCMTSPEYWLFGFIRFDVGGRKKLNIPDLGKAGKAVPPVRCAHRRRSAPVADRCQGFGPGRDLGR